MVTSSLGTPPDGETISFVKGARRMGAGTLSSGMAGFTISTLKVGTNAIKAVYSGDSNFAGQHIEGSEAKWWRSPRTDC